MVETNPLWRWPGRRSDSQHESTVARRSTFGIVTHRQTIWALASALSCGLLVILCAVSYFPDYCTLRLNVTPSFHVGLGDGRAYVFSHERPYLDGIISLSGTNAQVVSSWHITNLIGHDTSIERYGSGSGPISVTFFNLPGTRFREVNYFFESRPIWTFMVSLWYPILLLSVLPAIRFYRRGHFGFGSHENDK